jgi:hypothetical protein
MPYCSVTYQKSPRPYTFYTTNKHLTRNQTVLVKDKNGYSLCTFIGYVPKLVFPCNVVVLSQLEIEELADEVRTEMISEEEESNYDEPA